MNDDSSVNRHGELPSQASPGTSSHGDVSTGDWDSPLSVALGRARHSQPRHPCRGYGPERGRCPVSIPDDRAFCYGCSRARLADVSSREGPIRCPLCEGAINETDHFTTAGHLLAMRISHEDQRIIAQIARKPR